MRRNFTYIDDIVAGLVNCIDLFNTSSTMNIESKVYNLGNNKSEDLMHFIHVLENSLNKKAVLELMPLQAGDVIDTIADITDTERDFNFKPKTDIQEGLEKFVTWFKDYYQA